MSYNGWSNRETWLVWVLYNPESRDDVEYARSVIDEQYDNIQSGALKGMLSIDRINWDELLEQFEEKEVEK